MASELRVNSSTNRSGLGTITYTDSGPIISGVGTFTNGFTVDGTQTTVKSLKLTGDNYNANWFKTTNKLRFNDNAKATFGTSDDLSIFHNASDSVITHGAGGTGNLKILSGGAQSIECIKAGAVNISHNGSTKLATTAQGIDVTGHSELDNVNVSGVVTFTNSPNAIQMNDDARVSFGTSLKTSIAYNTSSSRTIIRNYNDTLEIGYRTVELHYINQARLTIAGANTFSADANTTFTGANYSTSWIPSTNTFRFNDNAKLAFGTQSDATIFHNNANLLISNTTGNINVTGNVLLNNDIDVDGHTDLDNVSIAGVTTFTNSYIDFKPGNGGNAHFRILSTGSGDAGIFFDAANGDIAGSDYVFIGQNNNLDFVINPNANAGNIDFQRAGSTKLRIDDHGVLRVGNTHDQYTSGNTKRIALGAKASIWGWASGQINGALTLSDNYYWDGSNNKAIESDYCAYLSLRSGSMRFGCTAASQTGGQNVSGGIHEKVRFENDGNVSIADGNLSFASGHGIDFSATGDGTGSSQAEILDDYEEGSWTPTVSTGNASFSTMTGTYVKIGRQVTLWFRISGGGSYSGSGSLGLQGIPFTNNTAVNPIGTSEFYKIDFARDYSDLCTCYLAGQTIRWLRNSSGGGSGNYLTVNLFYSGAAITGMLTYETNS